MEEKRLSDDVVFLNHHEGSVRGVAFHPTDRYLFCSCAYDGKVNTYSARQASLLRSDSVPSVGLSRNLNGIKFTRDGAKIIVTSASRRLVAIDVTTGFPLQSFDDCVFNGCDRTGLATDPENPFLIVCSAVSGKGLTVFDLRMPIPVELIYDISDGVIRDVHFLPNGWPWVVAQTGFLTAAEDGMCRVVGFDGRVLHAIRTNICLLTVTLTPEKYDSATEYGFNSLIAMGGDKVSICPCRPPIDAPPQVWEHLSDNQHNAPIWRLRYSHTGSFLYTACDGGFVRHYRRTPDRHKYLGELFSHKNDIEDMDISSFDEYLITASQDKSVGLYRIGLPNHGTTDYFELS